MYLNSSRSLTERYNKACDVVCVRTPVGTAEYIHTYRRPAGPHVERDLPCPGYGHGSVAVDTRAGQDIFSTRVLRELQDLSSASAKSHMSRDDMRWSWAVSCAAFRRRLSKISLNDRWLTHRLYRMKYKEKQVFELFEQVFTKGSPKSISQILLNKKIIGSKS